MWKEVEDKPDKVRIAKTERREVKQREKAKRMKEEV